MKKRKRIAILSMQRVENFGSVLQAYSLREMLREVADAQVTFLDIQEEHTVPSNKTVREEIDYALPAAYPAGIMHKGKRWIVSKLSAYNKKLIRRFMRQELKLDTKPACERYDCVVIGSDEVFNHRNGVCLQLHGDISQSEKIISYAASCGSADVSDILPEYRDRVAKAMGNFSAISIRDDATERYATALYSGPIIHHLDPVLTGNLSQRKHRPVWVKNYILIYAYGHRIRTAEEIEAIKAFAKRRNLKTVAIGGSQFWCDLYIPVMPMRVLDYFYYADYVITDTFHGAVFSVINQRKFAVLPRKTNENKISGLLKDLKLENRRVNDLAQLENVLMDDMDYRSVEEILCRERAKAREYLREHLGG